MKITSRKWFCTIAAVLVLLLVSVAALAKEKESSKDKAAVVNRVTITDKEYQRELDLYLKQAYRQGRHISDSMLPKIKNDILDTLIDLELLYQQSQKMGIDATKNL